ncbi:MAG: hypothetical protein WDZ49_14175 [Litorilinea sp.]
MNFHKKLIAWAAITVVAFSLSACAMGSGLTIPEREVPISLDSALEAQDMGMMGLLMGSVEWTEGQFSSLLTELIAQNAGEGNPIESVTAWFEPEQMYLRIALADGVLPEGYGNSVEVAGTIDLEGEIIVVNLTQAAAAGYVVSGDVLGPINEQINMALADFPLGLGGTVAMDTGTLSITLE